MALGKGCQLTFLHSYRESQTLETEIPLFPVRFLWRLPTLNPRNYHCFYLCSYSTHRMPSTNYIGSTFSTQLSKPHTPTPAPCTANFFSRDSCSGTDISFCQLDTNRYTFWKENLSGEIASNRLACGMSVETFS